MYCPLEHITWRPVGAMNPVDNPESPASGDRLSRLSQASIGIKENLDCETVLQDIVNSARSLAYSRYGALTVLDIWSKSVPFEVRGYTPGYPG